MVRRIAAHRKMRVPALVNQFLPFLHRVIRIQDGHVLPVRTDFIRRDIVKLKDVLNHFSLIGVNGSLLISRIHQHTDLLFRYLIFIFIGIYSQKTQNSIRRYRAQCHQRIKNNGNSVKHLCHPKRNFLRIFHGQPFRNKFTENQRQVGNQYGNQDNRHRR